MSRDRYSPRDDENRQEPEDIIRFQTPSRSPLQRRREARDEKLRRIRPSTSPREREGRYRESDQATTRPRQTRNFREEREDRDEERERPYRQESPEPRNTRPMREDVYREREARTTRPRSSRDLREYDYPAERSMNAPRRRELDTGIERDTDYRVYHRPVRRSGTRSSPPTPAPRTRKRRARRSIWSTLLIGVLGGIIAIALVAGIGWFFLIHTLQVSFPGLGIGTSTYTSSPQSVPLNITASITQLQVTNFSGNITISDNSAITSGGTLTYVKKTQASSSSSAASDFARIQVQALPGTSAACPATSCMTVSVNAPQTIPATVDLTLVLPAQSPSPPFVLDAKSTQTGNIGVQDFSGLLSASGNIGNIAVKGGLLDSGSCLQTIKGNITFAGTLATGMPPTINPCQGNPVTSGSSQPWYSFKDGTGNIDASLNAISANIILDAAVFNQGKISSEFPITIPPASPPSYDGPLVPGTHPSAILLITVDTGNITLHKV